MPRNEDGEFELILGNKQLLSVFFIVVTLLAVFFAMGFIMGRSVNPVAEARKVENGPSDKPIVVDAKPSASTGMTASARQVEIKSPEPEKKAEVKTKAQEPAKKEPEPKKVEEKKPEPKPEPKQSVAVASGKPTGGVYLQVAAVYKTESELVAEVLGKKGFHTMITPIEGKELYRVLVGPVKPGAEQAKIMDDLRAAGFKPFPRKF